MLLCELINRFKLIDKFKSRVVNPGKNCLRVMRLPFFVFVVIAALLLGTNLHAFAQDSEKPKIFSTKMRALDAGSLLAGDTKILLWGVRSIDNLPVLLAEKARIALDDVIAGKDVKCELKTRFEDYLLAQCVNSNDQDLGLLMIQEGFVSVERGLVYGSVFEKPYLQAEQKARNEKVGIWSIDHSSASQNAIFKGSWLLIVVVVLFIAIMTAFGILTIIIMRGFEKVIEAQNLNIEMLGRERVLKNKERAVVVSMLSSEIKANKSKIEAYLVVYEEMLADLRNPQRQPKYKKTGDILQKQPALERAVFDRNTDKIDVLGDELSSEVIHFYARIKTKPDYVNLEPNMPLDEAIALVQRSVENAKRMNKIADNLIDSFNDGGLLFDDL